MKNGKLSAQKLFYKTIIILLLIFQNYQNYIKLSKNDLLNTYNFTIPNRQHYLNIINEFYYIYNGLFRYYRNISIYPNRNNKIYKRKYNKILLCSVGKNENLYTKEFVEYYLSLGFYKIIIFDNNAQEGEKFDDILKEFILAKKVEIENIRGLKSIQIPAYNYCYNKNKNFYDWIAFFDFEEYLYINRSSNIKNYLYNSTFDKCESILFNWRIFGDNDLLKYDNRTLIERFSPTNITYLTKFIVRGNLSELLITSSHIAIHTNYCNSRGKIIFPESLQNFPVENKFIAYLRHYYTKTAEEFCNKILRGDVQFKITESTIMQKINKFFWINKKTPEKIRILEKCFNIKYREK